jgi:hypothetical protein
MKLEQLPATGRPPAAPVVEDDVTYYTRRAAEERILAETAASEVARSAHRALALIYEDHLTASGRRVHLVRSA